MDAYKRLKSIDFHDFFSRQSVRLFPLNRRRYKNPKKSRNTRDSQLRKTDMGVDEQLDIRLESRTHAERNMHASNDPGTKNSSARPRGPRQS